MGKRNRKNQGKVEQLVDENVLPFLEVGYEENDPLFSMGIHPSEPIFLSGLVSGNVYLYRYDLERLKDYCLENYLKPNGKSLIHKDTGDETEKSKEIWKVQNNLQFRNISKKSQNDESDEEGGIVLGWKTKRHKGSCRSICLENSGEYVYTVGIDKVIKKASIETGKVICKTDFKKSIGEDVNSMILSNSNSFLICGTELGDIKVFDTRSLNVVFDISKVHNDQVNSMINCSATSNYQVYSVGSTTLSKVDFRKGIISQSDDQDDEILSLCFPDIEDSSTIVCGMSEGIVTVWKDKNKFQDQLTRVKISPDVSVDAVISTMDYDKDEGNCFWCGDSNGMLNKIDCKKGKIVEMRVHDETGEVLDLDIDYDYRLVSSSMEKLKIWDSFDFEKEADEDPDSSFDSDSDSDSDSD
ncbi:Jip5p, partial [Ascoidea rubescens DSM 1968]